MHWISFDDKSNGYRIYDRNKILVERNIQFVKYCMLLKNYFMLHSVQKIILEY